MLNHMEVAKKILALYPRKIIGLMEKQFVFMMINAVDREDDTLAYSICSDDNGVYLSDIRSLVANVKNVEAVKKVAQKLGVDYNEEENRYEVRVESLETDHIRQRVGIISNFLITVAKLDDLLSPEFVEPALDIDISGEDNLESVMNELKTIFIEKDLVLCDSGIEIKSGVFDGEEELTFYLREKNGRVYFASNEKVYNLVQTSKYKDELLTMFFLKDNAEEKVFEVTLLRGEGADMAVNTLTELTTLCSNLEIL